MGYVISASFSDLAEATIASQLCNLPIMLFGGIFANNTTIPKFIAWIKWISPINYGFQAMVGVQYNDTVA